MTDTSPTRPAPDDLFAQLYAELRRMAHGRMRQADGITLLNTTALVHESYLRLRGSRPELADRDHFLAYASTAMRGVVVDLLRARGAQRRGGGIAAVPFDEELCAGDLRLDDEVLRVHEALDALAATDARLARVVELRYFGGLTEEEAAAILEVNVRTVQRDWQRARLFLSLNLR
ncbi:MAG: sigma-70 family RNA polymerase sigma factor [Ideonella sp.]|nr:sigma-70 family RNA polymerase sigma factor [Ideonella sp.]